MRLKSYFPPTHSVMWAVVVGFLFCLAQITFTWSLAPKDKAPGRKYFLMVPAPDWDDSPGQTSISTGYFRLNNWDSHRFFELAKNGYHIPNRVIIEDDVHHYRANITTPPAYPFLVRAIWRFLGVSGEFALLLAAQLAAWMFWVYFFLFLNDSKLNSQKKLWKAWIVIVHPASFYLICGYAESLFIASLMGFIFWTNRWLTIRERESSAIHRIESTYWALAATHGFIASATRIAGLPLGVFSFFQACGMARRKWFQAGLLSLFASMGVLSFFMYCQLKFGQWDIYFKLSTMVGQTSHSSAFFNPLNYIPHYFFEHSMVSLNRSGAPVILFMILRSVFWDRDRMQRFGYYITSIALLFIAMAGKSNSGMDGMIRYSLPIYLIMVLCFVQVESHKWKLDLIGTKIRVFWILFSIFSLGVQGWTAYRYLHGHWVS